MGAGKRLAGKLEKENRPECSEHQTYKRLADENKKLKKLLRECKQGLIKASDYSYSKYKDMVKKINNQLGDK